MNLQFKKRTLLGWVQIYTSIIAMIMMLVSVFKADTILFLLGAMVLFAACHSMAKDEVFFIKRND